jgi:hypothetical protein
MFGQQLVDFMPSPPKTGQSAGNNLKNTGRNAILTDTGLGRKPAAASGFPRNQSIVRFGMAA